MQQGLTQGQIKEIERQPTGTVSVREVLAYLQSDRYMTLVQTLEYLPLSERNIRNRLPGIPHYRVGKKLLFKRSELDSWMQNHREEAEGLDPSHLAEEVIEKLKEDKDDV